MPNLSQLITDLRARFRDVAGNFISATPATLYLNIAYEDFTNDTECNWREYGFYVTKHQYLYTLPADCLHTLTAMWYQNGQYEIPFLSEQEFKQRGYMNRRISVSTPQAYTIVNDGSGGANRLMLGPAPGTTSNTSTLRFGNNMNSSQTTMTLTSGGGAQFQSPGGMVLCESEQMIYQNNGDSGTDILGQLIRGAGGTTAASHTAISGLGTPVYRLDLIITYSYAFKYMSALSDTPGVPAQFQRIPLHYALALALKQDGRDKQAEAEFGIYQQKRLEAKRQVRILTRDKNNRRISTAYM